MSEPRVMVDRPALVVLAPRGLRENDAASYVGFSAAWLRNVRTQDMRRQAKGEPIQGPRWVHFGTAVRYFREDLDTWLDACREAAA